MMANVLVIGSGGREHALCWRLKQSPSVDRVYCAPGNAGIASVATCVTLADTTAIIDFCRSKDVALVVIGPEQPLVEGLADTLTAAGIATFGPSRKAAQLEGSKEFTKRLCAKYNIPTAAYGAFGDASGAKAFLADKPYPVVVKADGLAAGKGVIIAESRQEAENAIDAMLSGAFGTAGARIIIEEFLTGEEISFFALCDGKVALPLGAAQDHKRAYDGDRGPNTGGMGAYSPPPAANDALIRTIMETIIIPTVRAMAEEGAPFRGVLFAGLMLTPQGPKLLEYNARFGDPETQALMARLDSDLYPLLLACANGSLKGKNARLSAEAAICVVMAAKGYPGAYDKGSVIGGLDEAGQVPGVTIFHAGTAEENGRIIATGGRVLGITARAATLKQAQQAAYQAVDRIDWPDGFCRRDIGWRALAKP